MSIDLVVDIDGLYDLAGRLRGLQREFDAAGNVAEDAGVCDGGLREALHQFAANWSDKRRKISEMIDDVASCVENAGRVYEESEQNLSGNFAGSPGGGGGGGGW